ncbi:VOC family protein [Devosia sp. RR2S18]|uniref:VOC family protein n=1 Tax=Devosia rhizosphaerae TaxID=3049774 RepID=UPI0025409C76|nr:VOC family protein [Devosia sp. RR2S18]WIJ26520.1 VOC family protein [Devosia sp. RR2S18]
MTKIMPCLWFDDRIDEAIDFYTATFKNAQVHDTVRHGPDQPAFTAILELEGQKFLLLNGGDKANRPFTEAISFAIETDGQEETDYFWERLTSGGGEESMCGWCKDRFGLSWQVTPKQLPQALTGPDREGAQRAMQAMMTMRKIDVAAIERAYAGT